MFTSAGTCRTSARENRDGTCCVGKKVGRRKQSLLQLEHENNIHDDPINFLLPVRGFRSGSASREQRMHDHR